MGCEMDSHDRTAIGAFAGDAWKSAKFCGPNGGNCVEVNLGTHGVIGVRDSKPAAGPVLAFAQAGWSGFLEVTRTGRLGRV
jgi:hypothetical protein